ncbi:MAG: type II toxin-antitoxin system Phd/YefM family antitoxin [Opitutaceae bacterium]|jgi:antitoxin YefM|nr:type II toxin-antitoxin system Phd/YefM family antitoxin [Opitutaceae bacterium]
MGNTYSVKSLQRETATAIDLAAGGNLVTITRHDEPVAVLVSHERLSAILETMEILADPGAMKAINADRKGVTKTYRLGDLDD